MVADEVMDGRNGESLATLLDRTVAQFGQRHIRRRLNGIHQEITSCLDPARTPLTPREALAP